MRRLLAVVLTFGLIAAVPTLAPLTAQHVLSTPPHVEVGRAAGTFWVGMGQKFDQSSGKKLPVGGFASIPPTDITFVNPADDPRKK
jgi:hypothetical protein